MNMGFKSDIEGSFLTWLLILSSLLALSPTQYADIFPTIPSAYADIDPNPNGNPWQPYGPYVEQILVKVFPDEVQEFLDFKAGGLDGTDWFVPRADLAGHQANPDARLGPTVSDAGKFQVDANHWRGLFGIPGLIPRTMGDVGDSTFDGFATTMETNPDFIEVMKGMNYLIDKQAYLAETYDGQAVVNDCGNSQVGGGCLGADPTLWDAGTISAYNVAAETPGGGGASGTADLQRAISHFVAAGIPRSGNLIDAARPALGNKFISTERIYFAIRSDDINRLNIGIIISNALDMLFEQVGGQPVVNRVLGNIGVHGAVVFFGFGDDATEKDWSLYTGGWGLGPDPSHLRPLYGSEIASDICGGPTSPFRLNYGFVCDPVFDASAEELELGCLTQTCFELASRAALDTFGANAHTIEVYARASRYVHHDGWNGVVNHLGSGYPDGYSFINARPDESFVPGGNPNLGCPGGAALVSGQCSFTDTYRFGFRQGTSTLNIYSARTVWEAYILLTIGIYDAPLAGNPLGANVLTGEFYNWMTTRVDEDFRIDLALNPLGPDKVANTGDEGKVTLIRFTLRNDLTFHNGVPVTPDDIIKSYLSYRDVPQGGFGGAPAMGALLLARQVGSNIVELFFDGHSFFHKINSILPVLPVDLWDTGADGIPNTGDVGEDGFICSSSGLGSCAGRSPDASTSLQYDPLLGIDDIAGTGDEILVGSGPFMCVDRDTGVVGGGCSESNLGDKNVGGTVDPGGRFLLTVHPGFHLCCPNAEDTSFQKFSWSDVSDDGDVDVNDIADAAINFQSANGYWDHPLFGTDDFIVDISEIATVAFYFDHALTSPFSGSFGGGFVGMDAELDPFGVVLSGGTEAYYLGTTSEASGVETQIVTLGSPVAASSFTATLEGETVQGTNDPSRPGGILFTFSGIPVVVGTGTASIAPESPGILGKVLIITLVVVGIIFLVKTLKTISESGFSLSATPSSLTIRELCSGTTTITVKSNGRFSGTVDVGVEIFPSALEFDPFEKSVSVPRGGSASFDMTVRSVGGTGSFTITLKAQHSGGILTDRTNVSVTVTLPQC